MYVRRRLKLCHIMLTKFQPTMLSYVFAFRANIWEMEMENGISSKTELV